MNAPSIKISVRYKVFIKLIFKFIVQIYLPMDVVCIRIFHLINHLNTTWLKCCFQLHFPIVMMREVLKTLGISHDSVLSILKDHLFIKKLSPKQLPRLPTIDNERSRVCNEKILFHKDITRVHTCVATMIIFKELSQELHRHPLYYPDLATSNYFLFSKLKKWLGEKVFDAKDEIITQANVNFEGLDKVYCLKGVRKLEKRWWNLMELRNNHFGIGKLPTR